MLLMKCWSKTSSTPLLGLNQLLFLMMYVKTTVKIKKSKIRYSQKSNFFCVFLRHLLPFFQFSDSVFLLFSVFPFFFRKAPQAQSATGAECRWREAVQARSAVGAKRRRREAPQARSAAGAKHRMREASQARSATQARSAAGAKRRRREAPQARSATGGNQARSAAGASVSDHPKGQATVKYIYIHIFNGRMPIWVIEHWYIPLRVSAHDPRARTVRFRRGSLRLLR